MLAEDEAWVDRIEKKTEAQQQEIIQLRQEVAALRGTVAGLQEQLNALPSHSAYLEIMEGYFVRVKDTLAELHTQSRATDQRLHAEASAGSLAFVGLPVLTGPTVEEEREGWPAEGVRQQKG